jgi:hypothetical protein
MTDVISSGPERPARRRRPRTWLVGLVAAAALVGGIRLWDGGGSPDRPTATPPGPSPDRPVTRVATFRLDGIPGTGPPESRVLISAVRYAALAGRPSVVTGTGEVGPLDLGAAGGQPGPGEQLVARRLPGATVVFRQDVAARPLGAAVRPDRGRAVELGPGLDTVVAARGGGWLAARTGTDDVPGRLVGVGADGRQRWQRPLARPALLLRDTPYGLLVEVMARSVEGEADHGELLLVDPRTGRPRHRIGAVDAVLDSTDDRVAWIPYGCLEWPSRCKVAVTELGSRLERTYPTPDGRPVAAAAFPPDQTTLAVSFAGRAEFAQQVDPDGYVSVLPLATGVFERMPGLTTAAGLAATVTWIQDGLLVAGVNVDTNADRLLSWSPGQPGPVVLPGSLPPYTASGYLAALPWAPPR